jgi:hypothetical protein
VTNQQKLFLEAMTKANRIGQNRWTKPVDYFPISLSRDKNLLSRDRKLKQSNNFFNL